MRGKVSLNLLVFIFFSLLTTINYLLPTALYAADVPSTMSYQGFVKNSGSVYNGTGYFKFAIVNSAGTTTYWSNDGTSSAGSEPTNAVSTTVSNGIFNIILGDTTITNMTALDKTIFANGVTLYLRTWFSTSGSSFELLSPDKQITSSAYAMNAQYADSVTSGTISSSTITGGTVNNTTIGATTAAAGTFTTATVTTADINGGAIDGVTIGGSSAGAGTFSSLTATTADISGGTITGITDLAVADGGTGASTASGARTSLGLVISTDVQAYDADLDTIAGLSKTNGNVMLADGSNWTAVDRVIMSSGTPYNAFVGFEAGKNTTSGGTNNTFFGYQAGNTNTTGDENIAIGYQSLYTNTTGNRNVAIGHQALYGDDTDKHTGTGNIAIGYYALRNHKSGGQNVAIGQEALYTDTAAQYSVAIGYRSLYNQDGGTSGGNTAVGYMTGYNVGSSSYWNTFVGQCAGYANTTGSQNTYIGYYAGYTSTATITKATAIGNNAQVAQSDSLVLGGTGTDSVKVGIGDTTPDAALDILTEDADNVVALLVDQADTGTSYAIQINNAGTGDSIYDDSGAKLTAVGVFTDAPSWSWYKDICSEPADYIEKIKSLPVYEWKYRDRVIDGQNRYLADPYLHVSPFLDDFNSVFGLGKGDGVVLKDWIGITMVCIKEQQRIIEEQQEMIGALKKRLDAAGL